MPRLPSVGPGPASMSRVILGLASLKVFRTGEVSPKRVMRLGSRRARTVTGPCDWAVGWPIPQPAAATPIAPAPARAGARPTMRRRLKVGLGDSDRVISLTFLSCLGACGAAVMGFLSLSGACAPGGHPAGDQVIEGGALGLSRA